MKIVYHRGALRDLERIRKFIAKDNPKAAEDVIVRIGSAVKRLRAAPYSGRPGPRGIRLLTVPGLPYIVVHRVESDAVAVVAVFHTARDRKF